MTLLSRKLCAGILALLVMTPLAIGQARAAYTQAELDQMLAPIALYPDSLLSQILMAATYPIEVVEAARWSRANPGLQGDAAVRTVQDRDWDPSVKSLVAFPRVLARMDENIEWTRRLGEAFVVQEPVVMETIQALRRRAEAAGQLASDDRLRVVEGDEVIAIEPAEPQVIYVPYYDPWIVYGPWWWPAYPPVAWAPWPGYVRAYRPGFDLGLWWGAPVGVSVGFFFGGVDWHHREVRVVRVDNYYVRPAVVTRTAILAPGPWRHDPRHRRGAEFRDPAARRQFAAPAPSAAPALRVVPPAVPAPAPAPRAVSPATPTPPPAPRRERPREEPRKAPGATPPSTTGAVTPPAAAPRAEQPRREARRIDPPPASPGIATPPMPRRDEPRFGAQRPPGTRSAPPAPPAAAPMPPARAERAPSRAAEHAPAPRGERGPAPREERRSAPKVER